MRVLKRKTAQAPSKGRKNKKHKKRIGIPAATNQVNTVEEVSSRLRKRIQKQPTSNMFSDDSISPKSVKATKNIVKNYGRAICIFIGSSVSHPYLEEMIQKEHQHVILENFIAYIDERKESLDCIDRLKNMLVITENDSTEEASYKALFKQIGVIFIKYFSVNWIFSGRLKYKKAHLAFRYKMLRRLKNPELFTYLKTKKIKFLTCTQLRVFCQFLLSCMFFK